MPLATRASTPANGPGTGSTVSPRSRAMRTSRKPGSLIAGMPVISDPGFRLVRIARERGLTVEPVPGPFAGVLALVASGIAPLPFTFLGFTPHRHGERQEFYRRLATIGHTAI